MGAAVVGDECFVDFNVDMRGGKDRGVEPVWQRVKILAYNELSGEHEVVDVRDDGTTDPSRRNGYRSSRNERNRESRRTQRTRTQK